MQFRLQEDDRVAVVLRETVFYAQGGGQPSDVGTMEMEGGPTFVVEDVRSKGVRSPVSLTGSSLRFGRRVASAFVNLQ